MKTRVLTVSVLLSIGGGLFAQQPAPALKQDRISPKLSVIDGGCNITVLQTQAGPVIVDSGVSARAESVLSIIRTLQSRPLAAVLLTHYHGDHVEGLNVLAAGAPLYSHENCFASFRKQDAKGSDAVISKAGRLVPYTGAETKIQAGGESVLLVHPAHAHTSGDSVVIFEKEKVICSGDLFFNGLPPYIDVADGSDTAAWADTIESLAKRYPDFKVVPGHGPVSDMAGWRQFAVYLRALRQGVAEAIKAGKTREQAQASVDLDSFTSVRDSGGFLTKKANIGWVYDELTRK
jgi:glyoxylase-like metal-dependent hydrolase (beta-lactamase superfamily II)